MGDVLRIEDINEMRQIAAEDFRVYLAACAQLEHYDVPDFHYTMAEFLQGTRPEWRRQIKKILGFRLAAKSYILRRYCQWRQLRCPWAQVIIQSSTEPMAKRMARAYRRELNNNPIMAHLTPEPNTSELEFDLKGITHEAGYSVSCAGIGTAVTSQRCDIYVFDDPEPNKNPEGMYDWIVRAFEEAANIIHSPKRHLAKMNLTELPDPEKTQIIVVGQPHCLESVYFTPEVEEIDDDGDVTGHPLADAAELVIPATKPDGSWRWPQMMEAKYFDYDKDRPMTVGEVKRRFTPLSWQLEMMCSRDMKGLQGPVLRLDEIDIGSRLISHAVMAIDPADSAEGCEWGAAIGGLVGNSIHVAYLGGFTGELVNANDIEASYGDAVWEHLSDLARTWNVRTWVIEKNLKAAIVSMRRYQNRRGIAGQVVEQHEQANKLTRITTTLEPVVNGGTMSCSPSVMQDRQNVKQLANLKWTKLPDPVDRLDALQRLVAYLIQNPSLRGSGKPPKPVKSSSPVLARIGGGSSPTERY